MKFIILFCLLGSSSTVFAKITKSEWSLAKGKIVYHVHYPLKNVEGEATNVKGKGSCSTGKCEFLVAVPVKDFKSGDGNRDNHMLEVTKAALYPIVSVRVYVAQDAEMKALDAKADVNFAGKTHTYEHLKISAETQGNVTKVKGQLPLLLSHFDVERPSLLTVKIDDSVPLDFELEWN